MSLSVGIINYFTGAILTFRILYIMFNLFELLSIKYTMFPYGVQIMLSYFEISPIGVYTYYLFFELFLYNYYIHSLTLRIKSPILCCPCHIFTMPCHVHVHVHMTEEHIVSLRHSSSFCLRYPGNIKTHSRYISDRVKSISSHYYSHQSIHVRHYFLINLDPF